MAATKGAGNVAVTYDGDALTAYCNQADLNAVVAELEATDFSSTAEESDPGLTKYTIGLGGDWHATLDGYMGPDVATSALKTCVIAITDADSTTVTYTWTTKSFITNYSVSAPATGKITWTATLNLTGPYSSRA